MSDEAPGPGWWIASDGHWYPPELHPSVGEVRGEPGASDHAASPLIGAGQVTLAAHGTRTRSWGHAQTLVGSGVVALVLVVIGALLFSSTPAHPSSAPTPVGHGRRGTTAPTTSSTPPRQARSTTDVHTTDWLVGHSSPAQAVALARDIATSVWSTRSTALVAGDARTLTTIETGPALRVDLFHLAMVDCGCDAPFKASPVTSLQVVVPEQTAYPLDFLAAYLTTETTTPELMVFTKQSAQADWLVAFDTEADNPKVPVSLPQASVVPGQPAGIDPPPVPSAGTQELQDLVSYLTATAADNGSPPQTTAFGSTEGAQELSGLYPSPPSGTAQLPAPYTYSNAASVTPADGLWTFPVTGLETGATALTCGTIRDTTTNTATTSAPLSQNGQFGPFLNAGDYRTITQVAGMETCVISLADGSLDDFGDNTGGMLYSGTPAP